AHGSAPVEFPVLVTVGAEPRAAVVVPLVGESDRDATASEGPHLLDEPVVELPRPLALEKGDDVGASIDELRAVSPATVLGVGEGDALRLAGIPRIFGGARFLRGRLRGEGRQGWGARHV